MPEGRANNIQEQPNGGGLNGSIGPNHSKDRVGRNLQVNAVEGGRAAIALRERPRIGQSRWMAPAAIACRAPECVASAFSPGGDALTQVRGLFAT